MKHMLGLLLIFLTIPFVSADSQVDFIAVVSGVEKQDDGSVVLQMELNPDFILPVSVVEGETEIFDENDDEAEIEDIKVGHLLRIKGLFTGLGIFANEIIFKEDESAFRITGPIEELPGGRQIVISQVPINVLEDAEIKGEDGVPLEFADLSVGQRVRAKGDINEGSFDAFEVKLRSVEGRTPRIRFEGIVHSFPADNQMLVTIESVGEAVVIITGDTKIKGNPAVGGFVRIVGTINPDLTVSAKSIVSKQRLRVAPDELKMRFNQTRRVEVILREVFDQDVTLSIETSDPEIASPVTSTLTIPANQVTSSFEVTSGSVEGDAVITVALPEAGLTATVDVEVEDRDEPRDEDLELVWRPDDIRLRPGQEREVNLRLKDGPAPDGGLDVELFLKRGPDGVVEFPSMVTIPGGERGVKVAVKAVGDSGELKIRAQLPESVGGDTDDLEVQIRGEKGLDGAPDDDEDRDEAETEVRWSPREIVLGFNETRAVDLTLNQPEAETVVVTLSVKDGPRDAVEFPETVTFAPGETTVSVDISTREIATEELKIRAALPFGVGGDTDDLEVIIRE